MAKDKKPKLQWSWRLGPGGTLYLFAMTLVLVIGRYAHANLLYWGFGLMAGGLVFSALLPALMVRRLRIRRVVGEHGVAGDPLEVRYEVTNGHRLLPVFGLMLGETWRSRWGRPRGPLAGPRPMLRANPQTWLLHVGPGQTGQAAITFWPIERGVLNLERITASVSFPFGVFKRVLHIRVEEEIPVYPMIQRLAQWVTPQNGQAQSHGPLAQNQAGGHDEFYGMRRYRPGDSLRMVDWRRSARTGELVSREMTRPAPARYVVALDLTDLPGAEELDKPASNAQAGANGEIQATARERIERAISLTASLIYHAIAAGSAVGLVVQGVSCEAFEPASGQAHRNRMLEALARLDLQTPRPEQPAAMALRPTLTVRPALAGSSEPTIMGRGLDRTRGPSRRNGAAPPRATWPAPPEPQNAGVPS